MFIADPTGCRLDRWERERTNRLQCGRALVAILLLRGGATGSTTRAGGNVRVVWGFGRHLEGGS